MVIRSRNRHRKGTNENSSSVFTSKVETYGVDEPVWDVSHNSGHDSTELLQDGGGDVEGSCTGLKTVDKLIQLGTILKENRERKYFEVNYTHN